MSDVNFEELASHILLGIKTKPEDFEEFEYRKGKSFQDIPKKISLAKKKGFGKIEYEISMLEIYLKDIFKKKKRK